MNILYVITGLGLGGAEKVVVDLADQMTKLGHDVKIAYLKGNVVIKPENKDIELIYLGLESIRDLKKAFYNYKKVLMNFRPKVVHAHMVHANLFTRISRKFFPIAKLICTAHNSNEGGKIRMLAYRYTNFLSNINTNVSDEASDSLIKKGAFSKGDLITVYNGINLNKFDKKNSLDITKNDEEINFLSVGRFNEQKDYPNLLNAIFLLKDNINKKFKFYIAGDGELRPHIEALIKNLCIQDFVELLGNRSDIPDLLNQANFFVLPSKHEGLPTVVIEAMACETYVIATDCGGSAEILGDTGKLVPIQDSEALAKTIESVLKLDNQVIAENNQRARKRVEDIFSLDKSVNKWLEIYESK